MSHILFTQWKRFSLALLLRPRLAFLPLTAHLETFRVDLCYNFTDLGLFNPSLSVDMCAIGLAFDEL